MPLVTIKLIEGVFSQEQKQQMIDRVTEAMLSVEGENMLPVTWSSSRTTSRAGTWALADKASPLRSSRPSSKAKPKRRASANDRDVPVSASRRNRWHLEQRHSLSKPVTSLS